MTNRSDEKIASERGSSQRIAMRYLIEDPIIGWRRFPIAKAMLAYRSDLRLPESGGRTIRTVLALVILEGRKISEIHRLEASEWKLDSEGRVDREDSIRRIQQKLDAVSDQSSDTDAAMPPLSDADIAAIRRCLGLRERGS